MSSGDYFPEHTGQRLLRHLPQCRVLVVYGLTEAAGRMCYRFVGTDAVAEHDGAVGAPIAGLELNVFDDDMSVCPSGELGRVFVRGAYLFLSLIHI